MPPPTLRTLTEMDDGDEDEDDNDTGCQTQCSIELCNCVVMIKNARLAATLQRSGNAMLPFPHQTGSLAALQGPVRCNAPLLSLPTRLSERTMSSGPRTRLGTRARRGESKLPASRPEIPRPGLVLSRRVSDPSSRRKENSFARISETRLRNWLKAYNTFRGGKSHVRLRVFAQGKSRHHRQRHRAGGTTNDSSNGRSNSRKADSSNFSANQDVPRISISADEKRIYGQISEVLEKAMLRIVTRKKKDIARRQTRLIAMEYQKIKHEREKSSHESDDAPDSKKTDRSTQDRMKRIKKKTLVTLDQEKPANQLMPSPAVAKESREILDLFEKVVTLPRFKFVRNRQTGRRIRVPRVSDKRAKSIITDMRSSRYTERVLKDAFKDADGSQDLTGSTSQEQAGSGKQRA